MGKTQSSNGHSTTMGDIAAELGVSKMTVSFALNGNGRVSEKTRQLVLETARRLQFEPNPHAQRLRVRCRKTIGLFSLWLDLGVGSLKIRHIQHLLKAQGFDVPLHGVGLNDIRDEESQVEALAVLRRQKPRALVAMTAGLRPKAIEELQRYQDEGGLLVAYDFPTSLHCDQVIFDREDNTYQATRHLLELGHRAVGIGFHGNSSLEETRFLGYQRALSEFGVEPYAEWCLAGEDSQDFAVGGATLARRYLELKQRPTAMALVNDYAALVFMGEIQRAGLNCPQNVSLVGHDDHFLSRHHLVPLTTVTHPTQTIADSVVEFLLSRLNGEYDGAPRQTIVRGELIERQSTQPAVGETNLP